MPFEKVHAEWPILAQKTEVSHGECMGEGEPSG